jgi:hypothetical protein
MAASALACDEARLVALCSNGLGFVCTPPPADVAASTDCMFGALSRARLGRAAPFTWTSALLGPGWKLLALARMGHESAESHVSRW